MGYKEVLQLKVISSKDSVAQGNRVDTLQGTLGQEDTVVGDILYVLNCTAKVVSKVQRIDDFTVQH